MEPLAVARWARSAVLPRNNDVTCDKDTNVSGMLRGIFKLRPTLPKQVITFLP